MTPALGFGQIAPNLKSAADFAILAATEISFAPPESEITNMDIGLHPGVLSSITGLENLNLDNGEILASDDDDENRLPDAKQDLMDAYLYAAAVNVPAPATVSGNQGGSTLAPGIYKSTSTLSIEGTPLTLDADDNPNAVWIFQIASTLTTTSGGSVVLAGGAQAKNVYWQVGSSATLGDGTDFKGNILALVSITMNSGATIDGRVLARNGAVTFAGGGTMNNPDDELDDEPGELAITKTATPKTFEAIGEVITYDIVVENTGDTEVENIIVKDDLTNEEWTVTLASGVSQTFTTTYTIKEVDLQNGFVKNIATAEADDISVGAYEVVRKEGLLISKVATPKTYYAEGQVINYDIVVENIGTTTVTDITVEDELTVDDWVIASLASLESKVLTTTWTITAANMSADQVENTATASVDGGVVAEDTETVTKVAPPPPPPPPPITLIPLSAWTLVLAGILIAGFVVFQYRRSTPKRA